jgi:uncharacterized RDD family membrane protein YckC
MANPYAPPQAVVADVVDPRVQNTPAERGTRLAAHILDSLIFGVMVGAWVFAGLVVGGTTGTGPNARPNFNAAMLTGLAIGSVGFIAWCWLTVVFVMRNGQSIAKRLLHIKVVRSDGSPVTLGRIFWLRNVANIALGLIPFYGLVDPLFIFGEQRQCLHDKIADTIVVKA